MYNAELILDTIRFEMEREEGWSHGRDVKKMYLSGDTITYSSNDFIMAYAEAKLFARKNETDSILLIFKDDKYDYNAVINKDSGMDMDLIIDRIDGSVSEVEILSFNPLYQNLDDRVKHEVSLW